MITREKNIINSLKGQGLEKINNVVIIRAGFICLSLRTSSLNKYFWNMSSPYVHFYADKVFTKSQINCTNVKHFASIKMVITLVLNTGPYYGHRGNT